MKRLVCVFMLVLWAIPAVASVCGDGYVLIEHRDIDGIPAAQCEKLWCRDLETGKSMGAGDKPAPGYVATKTPGELCMGRDCVMCFGARRWCNGEVAGIWNPEYGAYTRGGADNSSYESSLRGGCFAWNLGKPTCGAGQMAVLKDGKWNCVISSTTQNDVLKTGARRVGGAGRRIF